MRDSPYDSKARHASEAMALEILGFLARDSERIGGFLAQTGVGPEAIRDLAREPGFHVALIDHLLSDEPMLLVFCEEHRYEPRQLWAARRLLGGDRREDG